MTRQGSQPTRPSHPLLTCTATGAALWRKAEARPSHNMDSRASDEPLKERDGDR